LKIFQNIFSHLDTIPACQTDRQTETAIFPQQRHNVAQVTRSSADADIHAWRSVCVPSKI